MWTPATRAQHSRAGLRCGSDLTDAEWAVLEPLLPAPSRTGRRPNWPMREIVAAIFHVPRGGVPRRMLPEGFPPYRTVSGWFARPRDAGVWQAVNFAFVVADRERSGREASPSAAVMDSRSVKASEARGPRGYDAGKKVKGRKRHALVDMDGRLLVVQVGSASVQDRDEAEPSLRASRALCPFIERAFADGAYAADRVAAATRVAVEIVRKAPDRVGFVVHPRTIRAGGSWNGSSPGSGATGV